MRTGTGPFALNLNFSNVDRNPILPQKAVSATLLEQTFETLET